MLDLLDEFYRSVVQNLKPWSAAPPKLRPEPTEVAEPGVPAQLVSTAISSQDDVESTEEGEDASPPTWHPDPVEENHEAQADDEVELFAVVSPEPSDFPYEQPLVAPQEEQT